MTSEPPSRGRSFGADAGLYDRLRPSPSEAALAWLLADHRSDILDLAAGTGQVSRQLLSMGCERVVAVEPDARMRAVFGADLPDVTVFDGTAEAIPLPAASMAAVVAGSAWHWFDGRLAAAEIGRVLSGGGVLGVLGIAPDISVDWVRHLLTPADLKRLETGNRRYTRVSLTGPFGPVEHAEFTEPRLEWVDDVVRSFETHSIYRESNRTKQAAITRRVGDRLRSHCSGASVVDLPMRTLCWRAVRLPD